MDQWLVLYDGGCGLCKWLLAGLLRWDRARRLRPVALQRPEAAVLLSDLAPRERMASWHLISPDGVRHSAGAALPPLLRLLPGGARPAVAFGRAPDLTQGAYDWVAEHRALLSKAIPEAAKQRAAKIVSDREQETDAGRSAVCGVWRAGS